MAEKETTKTAEAGADLPRVFNFNGMELIDPDPDMTPEQVKQLYAVSYPELTNAAISGPEVIGGRRVFKFTREIGTKG